MYEGEDDEEECEEDDDRGTPIGGVMKCGIKELRKRNPMTLDDAEIVISNVGLSVDEVEESLADADAEGYALDHVPFATLLAGEWLPFALAGFRPGGAVNAKKKAVRRIVDLLAYSHAPPRHISYCYPNFRTQVWTFGPES